MRVRQKTVSLWEHIQRTTFPGVQGTPYLNNIAAKAVFFKEMLSTEYRDRQFKIVRNAQILAAALLNLGHDVLTGGTDNHMLLLNLASFRRGLTGAIAQDALEQCGIVVNKNRLPYDMRPASVASGLRLGTPIVTRNSMADAEMDTIARMIDSVLRAVEPVGEADFKLDQGLRDHTRENILGLCRRFPMR
jgi:glycine hydroxymethyltransferase